MNSAEFHRWAALVIFLAGFASFLFVEKHRHWLALACAVLVVSLGLYTPKQAFLAVNWKIVIIFFTTLAAAEVFMLSGAAAYTAETILHHVKSPCWAILVLCSLTGFLSLFVENVACVLVAAPVALSLAERLKMPPQPILVACALASNLQGCGLLIGDPPSMLMAAEARLSFFQFVWYAGKPSIFWAVQAGAVAGLAHLWFVFRKHRGTVHIEPTARLLGVIPTLSLFGVIAGLAVATQIQGGIGWGAPAACAFFALVSFVWLALKTRGSAAHDEDMEAALFEQELPSLASYVKGLDWKTTLFILAVFVPVSALAEYKWVDSLANAIKAVSFGKPTITFAYLVVASMIISGFVDNIPFLLVMLPAVTTLGNSLGIAGKPMFLYFGLLLGTSVGGNITPIGAQANVAAVGLLRKHGHPMKLKDYMALSLPYTILAVAASCAFTYLIYGPK